MVIGVPREIKDHEYRVSVTPDGVQALRQAVIELDTARTRALIEQVTERDVSLGRALDKLATRLDYKRLLKLLEKEHAQTRQTL